MSDVSEFFNDSKVYRILLESTNAVPWKIDWTSMKFAHNRPSNRDVAGLES